MYLMLLSVTQKRLIKAGIALAIIIALVVTALLVYGSIEKQYHEVTLDGLTIEKSVSDVLGIWINDKSGKYESYWEPVFAHIGQLMSGEYNNYHMIVDLSLTSEQHSDIIVNIDMQVDGNVAHGNITATRKDDNSTCEYEFYRIAEDGDVTTIVGDGIKWHSKRDSWLDVDYAMIDVRECMKAWQSQKPIAMPNLSDDNIIKFPNTTSLAYSNGYLSEVAGVLTGEEIASWVKGNPQITDVIFQAVCNGEYNISYTLQFSDFGRVDIPFPEDVQKIAENVMNYNHLRDLPKP
jgi:hypothetical protein